MGGSMQPQSHVQVLINLIDYGMNLQAAGDAARVRHEGVREPTGIAGDPRGVVYVESGVPSASVDGLERRGHAVKVGPGGFGGYQAIMRDPVTGVYAAAAKSRKVGAQRRDRARLFELPPDMVKTTRTAPSVARRVDVDTLTLHGLRDNA